MLTYLHIVMPELDGNDGPLTLCDFASDIVERDIPVSIGDEATSSGLRGAVS